MRRRTALFASGFLLAVVAFVGVAAVGGWLTGKRSARRAPLPPNVQLDPEPLFKPVDPFTEPVAGEPVLFLPKQPGVKPLAPAAVPTLQPTQLLGNRRERGPTVPYGPLALSADGAMAAFTSAFATMERGEWVNGGTSLMLWDVAAGREISRVGGPFARFALSPDGRSLYAGGAHEHFRGAAKLVVWDVRTGRAVRERPTGLWALSADGKTLATVDIHVGTFDRMHADEEEVPWRSTLAIWNAADFTLRSAFTYTSFVPTAVAISADGSKVACGASDVLATFDAETGKKLWRAQLEHEDRRIAEPFALRFSPDGKHIASAEEQLGQTVRLWNAATGELRTVVANLAMRVHSRAVWMEFTSDSAKLVLAVERGAVPIDVAAGAFPLPIGLGAFGIHDEFFRRGIQPPGFELHGFALSADGKTAIFGGRSQTDTCGLRVVDVETRAVKFPAKIEAVKPPFPPAGIYPLTHQEVFRETLAGPKLTNGRSLCWMPSGPLTLNGPGSGETRVGIGDTIGYVVTPDGETLITRGRLNPPNLPHRDDPLMRFRDADGDAWGEAPGPTWSQIASRRTMRTSADGRTLAALHPDGGIWLWEVATTEPRLRLDRAGPEDVFSFTFSRDGRYLMSNDYHAQTGLVWDLSGAAGDKKSAPDEKELAELWDALRGDAAGAYRAAWRLATHSAQAVPFLKDKAKVVPAVTDPARRALRPFDRDIVMARRFVEVLELCGTPEAVALLKELTAGPVFGAPAGAALKRLVAK